jgi:hypothetical protein
MAWAGDKARLYKAGQAGRERRGGEGDTRGQRPARAAAPRGAPRGAQPGRGAAAGQRPRPGRGGGARRGERGRPGGLQTDARGGHDGTASCITIQKGRTHHKSPRTPQPLGRTEAGGGGGGQHGRPGDEARAERAAGGGRRPHDCGAPMDTPMAPGPLLPAWGGTAMERAAAAGCRAARGARRRPRGRGRSARPAGGPALGCWRTVRRQALRGGRSRVGWEGVAQERRARRCVQQWVGAARRIRGPRSFKAGARQGLVAARRPCTRACRGAAAASGGWGLRGQGLRGGSRGVPRAAESGVA